MSHRSDPGEVIEYAVLFPNSNSPTYHSNYFGYAKSHADEVDGAKVLSRVILYGEWHPANSPYRTRKAE